MTKKEFIEKYSLNAGYSSKAWKVIVSLDHVGELSLFKFCEATIKEVDISRFSGVSLRTLVDWKKEKKFVYAALREKSVLCLVAEYESCVVDTPTTKK